MFEDTNEENLEGIENFDIAPPEPTESEDTEPMDTDAEQSEKAISADLIRGHINTIILRALYDGDKYGYEIITEIEKKSHGQYSLKQPSLYSALKRLEREGYVTSYWGGSVAGGRRKYFSLTDNGKNISERNQSEWEYSRTVIDSLISDKQFDFENSSIPLAVDMRMLKQSTSRVPSREEDEEEKKTQDEDVRAERAALEEAKLRYEEECRTREQELLAREEALKNAEEEYRKLTQEQVTTISDEERKRMEALSEELDKQNSRVAEMQSLISQHAEYERQLEAQAQAERENHERALEEQEARIRRESEILYRQREREMMHQNYLNLVNRAPEPTPPETAYYNAPAEQEVRTETPYYEYPEKNSGYRSVIQRLYGNSVQQSEPVTIPEETPTAPAPTEAKVIEHESKPAPATTKAPVSTKTTIKDTRSLSGIDFYDLESLAAQDGIKITTAGGAKVQPKEEDSHLLFNKGKALFFSALVVFLLCLAEGSLALGFQSTLSLPRFYPYFIWGTGLALLFITGLAYINRYGERTIRRSGTILINTVVTYALCVIVVLIVALAVQINFANRTELCTYVIFPLVYLFGVIAFGVTYYAQAHPFKE